MKNLIKKILKMVWYGILGFVGLILVMTVISMWASAKSGDKEYEKALEELEKGNYSYLEKCNYNERIEKLKVDSNLINKTYANFTRDEKDFKVPNQVFACQTKVLQEKINEMVASDKDKKLWRKINQDLILRDENREIEVRTIMEYALKKYLKDPGSYQCLSFEGLYVPDADEVAYWLEYTATNSFGGRVRGILKFDYDFNGEFLRAREK